MTPILVIPYYFYMDRTKYWKEYKLKNKDRVSKSNHLYYLSHKEDILSRHLKYINNKRKTDLQFRIYDNLRSRIYHAIKHRGKSARTEKLIGCSIKDLEKHLKKQFAPGMTFKNYGRWHIDHIQPCISFNLSIPKEQMSCFHFTNLQPLWKNDNLKKGKKVVL